MRGEGSNLTAFVVVVLMLFLLALYMVVAVPTLTGTSDAIEEADNGKIEEVGLQDNYDFAMDVGIVLGPTFLGVGIIAYLYAVVSGRGSFRGGGPR